MVVGYPRQATHAAKPTEAPDSSAIIQETRASEERVLFSEDFETKDAIKMEEWYGGSVPHKVEFSGVTTEQAFSGKRSYKIQVQFDPGRWGATYVRLPMQVPAWSDLKLRMYVKTQSPLNLSCFHGMGWGDLEEPVSGNVLQGKKARDENGWEVWEASMRSSGSAAQYIEGPSVMFQLPDNSPATTVTIYVDNITLTGKLPADWAAKWDEVQRYYTVEVEKQRRDMVSRRLSVMRTWHSQLAAKLEKLALPPTASTMLVEQHEGLVRQMRSDLQAVKPLLEEIEKRLADQKSQINANVNKPERLLVEANHYLDIASAYPGYAAKYSEPDVMTFTLDLTQGYRLLPEGAKAHNDEASYYNWDERAELFENPQILPETSPVPATPSRAMRSFGCRGTYVPFSFVLRAGRELKELTFAVSDLRSKSGTITGGAIDLRVVAPWFRPFGGKPRLMNEMLLHDPEFAVPLTEQKKNRYKDAKYGNDADKLLPLTIPAGTNRQFYLTVRIPDKAAAGVYRGNITGKSSDGRTVSFSIELEVVPFDLEPTPYAYSAYYRIYRRDDEQKTKEGIASPHSFQIYRSLSQMEAEFRNMAEHGLNTLNLYEGAPVKKNGAWDFSELDTRLAMAKRAGLTRSPFIWLGHGVFFIPDPRPGAPHTSDEVISAIKDAVPAVNEFCRKKGYPKPAFYGHDEASGDALMQLQKGYEAVNQTGGLVAVACYPNYFPEVGTALSLPIVYGGAQTLMGQRSLRDSQKAGYECWIYNCPATNLPASPSAYRRRYGLALWKNGEQGAAPWEYCGVSTYEFNYANPVYAFSFPTWKGKPIDTVIYEAFREGIYDTRYMATLQKYLKLARKQPKCKATVAQIDRWLATFSVNEDLRLLRKTMVECIARLRREMKVAVSRP
ncbi:MAG: hypothetical protein HY318_09425 [Armatimonadetes bacterium]|nr:hypothetical protein [Armatimonadota bacterium]